MLECRLRVQTPGCGSFLQLPLSSCVVRKACACTIRFAQMHCTAVLELVQIVGGFSNSCDIRGPVELLDVGLVRSSPAQHTISLMTVMSNA